MTSQTPKEDLLLTRQQDVYQEVCAATTLKEYSERGQEDGKNDL